jgi:hypothetical protein
MGLTLFAPRLWLFVTHRILQQNGLAAARPDISTQSNVLPARILYVAWRIAKSERAKSD